VKRLPLVKFPQPEAQHKNSPEKLQVTVVPSEKTVPYVIQVLHR